MYEYIECPCPCEGSNKIMWFMIRIDCVVVTPNSTRQMCGGKTMQKTTAYDNHYECSIIFMAKVYVLRTLHIICVNALAIIQRCIYHDDR